MKNDELVRSRHSRLWGIAWPHNMLKRYASRQGRSLHPISSFTHYFTKCPTASFFIHRSREQGDLVPGVIVNRNEVSRELRVDRDLLGLGDQRAVGDSLKIGDAHVIAMASVPWELEAAEKTASAKPKMAPPWTAYLGDVPWERCCYLICFLTGTVFQYNKPMPRQARLDVPGALHHIMVRGINKTDQSSPRRP